MTSPNIRAGTLSYPEPTLDHAELLLGWRTRPDITQYLLTDIEHDLDAQRRWLTASTARPGFLHRLIAVDTVPVGYCSITTTDSAAGIGTIGVYLAEKTARSGIASFNFIHILNHAFLTLGLHKIVNHIMSANERVIRSQVMNGYRPVGILREHAIKYGRRHDLHVFEQLRDDWLRHREKFGDYRDLDGIRRFPESTR
jgi:RimJ/RimL family protein N-acetyltransferase